jgi:hypothetical protein
VIKPIETQYDGYRFRSRLEARWAVFFNSLGIEWQYEPQGFEFKCTNEDCERFSCPGHVNYLPDFYLPKIDWYVEVKAKTPVSIDMYKLTLATNHFRRIMLLGNIPRVISSEIYPIHCMLCSTDDDQFSIQYGATFDKVSYKTYVICRVPSIREYCSYLNGGINENLLNGIYNITYTSDNHLANSYSKARSARFEYGESG